jgi:hypothetical protein
MIDLSEVIYGEQEMTFEEAKIVRKEKRSCTYRKLAEIFIPRGHMGFGNQGVGESLCRIALRKLYPNDDIWMMYKPEEKFGQTFVKDNQSLCGDFYWWE